MTKIPHEPTDMARNSDPQRLAALDAATRERLERKYSKMRTLLRA